MLSFRFYLTRCMQLHHSQTLTSNVKSHRIPDSSFSRLLTTYITLCSLVLKPHLRIILAHVTENLAFDLLVGRPLRIRIPLPRHVRTDHPRAERAEHRDGLL